MIYLDYAAATPVDSGVLKAMQPYWQDKFHNPSSLYDDARRVAGDLRAARQGCAKLLGVKSQELYFTAGATEANNMVVAGCSRQFPGSSIVISNVEHDAIRRPAHVYSKTTEIPVKPDGRIKVEDIVAAIDKTTVLVSIGYVNSEIGTIQPLRDAARAIKNLRLERAEAGDTLPIYLHSDISQAPGHVKINLESLGLDMATINGAKIYGPKQSGLLYVRRSVAIAPMLYGGGQERSLRSGTENVAFAIGIAKALAMAEENRDKETAQHVEFRYKLLDKLQAARHLKVNGSLKHRIASNLNLSFPGLNGEMLVHYLDAAGIQAATGSACSANYDTPSHVLVAIGCTEEEISGSLRLSFGRGTAAEDIDYVGDTLVKLTQKLRAYR